MEICRFGRRRFDLIADLFQDGCDGLGCEDAGRHNILFPDAKPTRGVDRLEERLLVLARHALPEAPERLVSLDRVAGLVAHPARHN